MENFLDFNIDGYVNYNNYIKFNTSDGISVYIYNLIQVNFVKSRAVAYCSSLNIQFSNNEKFSYLSWIYQSLSSDKSFFLDRLDNYLNTFSEIFCSDIYINLHIVNNYSVNNQNILSSYDFKPRIYEITRNNIVNSSTSALIIYF